MTSRLNARYLKGSVASTPLMVTDLDYIQRQFYGLKANLPNTKIYYAVKACPAKPILKRLYSTGCGFEIASIGELDRLTELDVEPRDVIFSNPVKIPSHIKQAYDKGVIFYAVDSTEEVDKLHEYAPHSKVYLRINVSNKGSLIKLSDKFGATIDSAVSILTYARKQGLEPIGIAFHVGSQAESLEVWDSAFSRTVKLMKELLKAGIKMKVVNIGGGFPVDHCQPIPSIEDIAARIRANVAKLPYEVDLWCEPGRYLVAESSVIVSSIIGKVRRGDQDWLFLDVGRFQAFVEMFESDSIQYPVTSSKDGPNAKLTNYVLTGPTCDSCDTITHNALLPETLMIGDKVYFGSAGAYTVVYGAPFNDFQIPSQIFLSE